MSQTLIDPQRKIPLYSQLKTWLQQRILDGTYPPQSLLPSEAELGQQFGVSRITVRLALSDLSKEGLIYKLHGKGTFVAKPKAIQNVSTLQGLAESFAEQGLEVSNRLLSFQRVTASSQVESKLALNPGSQVLEIKRLRFVNREVVSLEITYLPEALFEPLARADLAGRDLFLILENDLGLELGQAELSIDAVLAQQSWAQALNISESAPILRIERLTRSSQGQPLDFEYLYYRGDRFQYHLHIERQKGKTR